MLQHWKLSPNLKVILGLGPRIQSNTRVSLWPWIAGSSPAMTKEA